MAKKSLVKIEGTPGFTQEIEQLHSMCDDMTRLQKLYKENDFYACYDLIDTFPHLYFSELGELLQKHWAKLMHECEEYASKGSVKDIKATLGELIKLNGRKDKTGDLLRVSFQVQIKFLLAKKSFNTAQNLIYSYIDIFTQDNEISSLMMKYEALTNKKLAITISNDENKTRNSWLNSKIITE